MCSTVILFDIKRERSFVFVHTTFTILSQCKYPIVLINSHFCLCSRMQMKRPSSRTFMQNFRIFNQLVEAPIWCHPHETASPLFHRLSPFLLVSRSLHPGIVYLFFPPFFRARQTREKGQSPTSGGPVRPIRITFVTIARLNNLETCIRGVAGRRREKERERKSKALALARSHGWLYDRPSSLIKSL